MTRPHTSYKKEAEYWERRYNDLKEASKINNLKKEEVKTKVESPAEIKNPAVAPKILVKTEEEAEPEQTPETPVSASIEAPKPQKLDIEGTHEEIKEAPAEKSVNKCGECGAVVDSSLICECGEDFN